MYAKRIWNTPNHFKERAIKQPEFSELSQVPATIVGKHKYFLLIKKASSRCILPQACCQDSATPHPPTPVCAHTHSQIHTYTLLWCLYSNPFALTVSYIQPNLRKVITLIVSRAVDSSWLAANLSEPGCQLRTGDTSSDGCPVHW